MNRTLSVLIALLMVLTLSVRFVPVSAVTAQGYPDDYSQEKLIAFWQQEAYDGMTNGEAVYAVDWRLSPEHYYYYDGEYPTYGGSYWTPLVYEDQYPEGFMFLFGFRVSYWDTVIWNGYEYSVDGWDYFFPDLYGDLDLAGTNVTMVAPYAFDSAEAGDGISTHLSSVNVDGCELLQEVKLVHQELLESVSALLCPRLASFTVKDSACRDIDFKTADMEKSLSIGVIGSGSVGAEYTTETHNLYACGEGFLGWYLNGGLISTEPTLTEPVEGRVNAVFAGDADGDGVITTSDALIILRCSIGVAERPVNQSMDVNSDGVVDSSDALTIMRLVLGVL